MDLNNAEIAIVSKNLNQLLCPGVVREIYTPRSRDLLILEIRTVGENHAIQISLVPGFCHIGRLRGTPPRSATAHPFAMQLRRTIANVPLTGISVLNDDRIISLTFSGNHFKGSLICELLGRSANLYLVDHAGLILGCFHPERARRRALDTDEPWIAPVVPAQLKPALPRFSESELCGFELAERFSAQAAQADKDRHRVTVQRVLHTALKRTRTLLGNLRSDMERAARADSLRAQAHVLQAHLRSVSNGQTSLEATDFTGEPVVIPLDPALDGVGNMERLFDKARRLGRATPQIEEKLLKVEMDCETLTDFAAQISEADDPELISVEQWLSTHFGDLIKRAVNAETAAGARLPYREYAISGNRVARVGKSAADNDALTLRCSSPRDLWLHVRGASGSHVVVPLKRGETFGQEELLDAAHLAARFSSVRSESTVEITYTTRRYVQKMRGHAPGSVKLLQEKTFLLRIDPGRMARILASRTEA